MSGHRVREDLAKSEAQTYDVASGQVINDKQAWGAHVVVTPSASVETRKICLPGKVGQRLDVSVNQPNQAWTCAFQFIDEDGSTTTFEESTNDQLTATGDAHFSLQSFMVAGTPRWFRTFESGTLAATS